MKQYCRYCAFAFEGDCYYCGEKDKVLSESAMRRVNNCPDFALSDLGDVITGKQYEPRQPSTPKEYEQLTFEGL